MGSYFFKSLSYRLIYFLTCILCTHPCELLASNTFVHQSLKDFETEKQVDQLLLLIQKRLVIMHEVARTKWNQNLAIEDLVREQQILTDLVQKASKYGLDEKWVATFFQAQMDASKEIQKNDFAIWKEQSLSKFENVLSLKEELRSYIDQINQEMMILLSKIHEMGGINSKFILAQPISTRETDHIENDVWLLAVSPLK